MLKYNWWFKVEFKRYSLAIIGGFLSGSLVLAVIVLMRLYSPIDFPLVSFFLAPLVNKGYRLFKGRVNKKLPKIIIVVSVILLIVLYFIIFPLVEGSLKYILEPTYWKKYARGIILSLVGAIVGIYKTYEDILYEIGLRY